MPKRSMIAILRYRCFVIKTVVVIITSFCQSCFSKEMDPVPRNNIAVNGAFVTLYGYASKGPKIESHICRSMLNCGHLCLKNPQCLSYNYQLSTAPNGLCELSQVGIASEQEREKLKKMPGFVFVQAVRTDLVRPHLVLLSIVFSEENKSEPLCFLYLNIRKTSLFLLKIKKAPRIVQPF